MIILGLFLIILQIIDIITTNIGIKNGCEEVNPFLKKSLKSGFPLYLAFTKIGLGTLLTYFLSLGIIILNWIFFGLDLFLLFVVINNTLGIHMQKKWNRFYSYEYNNMKYFTQFLDVRNWIALAKESEVKNK